MGRLAALRISVFYAAFFLTTGIQLPFWPVWLAGRGLGAGEIGALLAMSQWIKVAANPLLGVFADRVRDRHRFMVLLGAVTVGGYLLCVPARGFAALILPTLIVAAASTAMLPLADATALAAASDHRFQYGRVRLWGTIAFIVATVLGGRALMGRSSETVLYLLLGAMSLAAASCALLPRTASPARVTPRPSWRALLTRPNVTVLVAAMLIQSSHAVYYGFGTLYWQRLGFSDATIAWLWAEGAIVEVLLFLGGGRWVERWGAATFLALGGAGGVMRWMLTAYVTTVPAFIAIQPLHALTFAAAHLGAMHHIGATVPREQAGTAQSFYAAMVSGLGLGLASLAAGWLYAAWGGNAYIAMAVMAGLGGLLAARLPVGSRHLQRR
ncbi:MAG TPA: MFS transporter [Stellaceae bacterium]|nr:MFS transporter [Stellaceae bacterium]